MNKNIAISVKNVSKNFRIPHQKVDSLRSTFVGAFHKKTYEEFRALDNVSFEVKKGEFFGVIGRNGSGKSTLLKILAGIYKPDTGTVKINGRISPFLELGIGFNPELSGRDNVYLNATVLGLTKKQIDEKFDEIVAFSELERFIDQKLKNYSSGMQVRLAFAVSIHANREILLMDEVLAVGDSNFQSKCLQEFRRYKKEEKTVVIVTHNIGVVQEYCDRGVMLRNGLVKFVGDADELSNQYIKQNIYDVGARSEKEHCERKNDSLNDPMVAHVSAIEFYDSENRRRESFGSGEDLKIKIAFRIKQKKKRINIGVSIFSSERVYLFGTNTIFDHFKIINNEQDEIVEINLRKIPLTQGVYYARVVIVGEDFTDILSTVRQSRNIYIQQRNRCEGLLNMDREWKISEEMENEEVSICFTIDKNYAEHCAVTMTSVLHNSKSNFHFFIVSNNLDQKEKEYLRIVQKKVRDCKITFIEVDIKNFEDCHVPEGSRFIIANYFRLRLASILPHLEKIIYMDADMIANADLKELWNEKFDGNYMMACRSMVYERNSKRLGLSKKTPYINSGLIVMDLKSIRRDGVEKLFTEYQAYNPDNLVNVEQDVLNLVLVNRTPGIKQLSQQWNVELRTDIEIFDDYKKFVENPYILHFITDDKPWKKGSRQRYGEKYWEYKKFLQ
ncbi:MAG: ATP-binding cassette domain-containing protein [Candidatus Moranbacteria bacterium]|nr:ATP-binding cassette domain-containing protein [Candidatus Moranbacteria bacterium]